MAFASQRNLLFGLFLLDTVSVSILVPFLPEFYALLPFTSTSREYLSSVYSISQIVGGLFIGRSIDIGGTRSKRRWLLLSFLGSAISYYCVNLAFWISQADRQTTSSPSSEEGNVSERANFDVQRLAMFIIVASRVMVGLIKQTQTITTSLITTMSHDKDNEKGSTDR